MSILDDDGNPSVDFIAIEEPDEHGHKQALWLAVRPVWYGNVKSKEPMVQISYQEEYLKGPLVGCVWLTPETWEELKKAVDWRIRYQQHSKWHWRWVRFKEFWGLYDHT